MSYVYILYSKKLAGYYIGSSSLAPNERLSNHNDMYYENKYTSKGIPWEIFWQLETPNLSVALQIEKHIKRMKSRVYIQNLKIYPEMAQKLLIKYS